MLGSNLALCHMSSKPAPNATRPGKQVRARYIAALHEIAERNAELEIIGPPKIRTAIRILRPFRWALAPRPPQAIDVNA